MAVVSKMDEHGTSIPYTHSMDGFIGIDEVGRGPLAGPVTVCACFVPDQKAVVKDIFGNTIRDSKKLSKRIRNNIYETIRKNGKIKYGVVYAISSRSSSYIDRHGITKAIDACIRSCLANLTKHGVDLNRVVVRVDAGIHINGLNYTSHIKGDETFVEIALASVLAKVTRDARMEYLSRHYDGYGWERNVGYGTKEHREAILVLGTTKEHRISFLKGFKLLDKTK